jgi:hypothetical protein
MSGPLAGRLCSAIAVAALGSTASLAQSSKQEREFHSERFGYRVEYPPSWYINPYPPSGGVLNIINFPPSEATHAVFLPRGGASITFEPIEAVQGPVEPRSSMRRRIPHTLAEWVEISNERRKVLSSSDLVLRGGLHATEVRVEYSTGAEAIDWFFGYRGRAFRATLVFWRADDDSEKLVPVLRQVVMSIQLDKQ